MDKSKSAVSCRPCVEEFLRKHRYTETWLLQSHNEQSTRMQFAVGSVALASGFPAHVFGVRGGEQLPQGLLVEGRAREEKILERRGETTTQKDQTQTTGGCERLCLQVRAAELDRLFVPTLTLDGMEGSYPEMPPCSHADLSRTPVSDPPCTSRFNQHPKNMGLCFSIAPSGRDVLLIEAGTKGPSIPREKSMAETSAAKRSHRPRTG